jgi:hypothetical protein
VLLYYRKHDRLPALLFIKGLVDQPLEVRPRFHGVGNPAKDVFQIILRNFPKQFCVLRAHGFETDHGTLQSQRQDNIQRTCAHDFLSQYQIASLILHLAGFLGISITTWVSA